MPIVRLLSLLMLSGLAGVAGVKAQTPAQSTAVSSVPSWFTRCAGENTPCVVRGPAQVIFGASNGSSPKAGGGFVAQALQSTVACSNATFGDPSPGQVKGCWYGPLPTAGAGKIQTLGGSDYPFSVQNYENWDNNQRTVVGQYHLAPGLVQAQLKQMYQAGQRNVALVIWYMPYGPADTAINGVVDGAFLDSSSNQLSSQAQQNLTAVLGLIKGIGYPQVTIRFAPVGDASPASWGNTWREAQFQQDEAFEFSARQVAETALAGSNVARVYDLGVEMGGIPHNPNSDGVTYADGQSPEWTTRLWKDYVSKYGKADSYGFTIAYSSGTLTSAIAAYDAAGTRPNSYAIDTTVPSDLWNYYQELVGAGDAAKPLVIQETSYNDTAQMSGIQAEIAHFPLTIAYVDQWPVSITVANADASPPADYGAYGGSPYASGTLVIPACTLADGQSTCTTQASWSTSNASNVGLYVNGVLAANAANIRSSASGTATVSLGLTPTLFVLASSQGLLSSNSAGITTASSASATLTTLSASAIDPHAPVITLAGLGGINNQAIWALGSGISAGCTAELYDPASASTSPLVTISNPNCSGASISFAIPHAILTQYSAVTLVVTNPGSHNSIAYPLTLQTVPTLAIAGLGGPGNQWMWAVGSGISAGCSVQLYDPANPAASALVSVTAVSCQSNTLSFAIPAFLFSNYTNVGLSVTNANGQVSSRVTVPLSY